MTDWRWRRLLAREWLLLICFVAVGAAIRLGVGWIEARHNRELLAGARSELQRFYPAWDGKDVGALHEAEGGPATCASSSAGPGPSEVQHIRGPQVDTTWPEKTDDAVAKWIEATKSADCERRARQASLEWAGVEWRPLRALDSASPTKLLIAGAALYAVSMLLRSVLWAIRQVRRV
jgi:hypothetical protein